MLSVASALVGLTSPSGRVAVVDFAGAGFLGAGVLGAGVPSAGFFGAGFLRAGVADAGFALAGFALAGFTDAGFTDAGAGTFGRPAGLVGDFGLVSGPVEPFRLSLESSESAGSSDAGAECSSRPEST